MTENKTENNRDELKAFLATKQTVTSKELFKLYGKEGLQNYRRRVQGAVIAAGKQWDTEAIDTTIATEALTPKKAGENKVDPNKREESTKWKLEKLKKEVEKLGIDIQRKRDELIDKNVVSEYTKLLTAKILKKIDELVNIYPELITGKTESENTLLLQTYKSEFLNLLKEPMELSNKEILEEREEYNARKVQESNKRKSK